MDKKEFIFPGVILGVVIIIAIALLVGHSHTPALIPDSSTATSTATSTDSGTSGTTSQASSTAGSETTHSAGYYPYGTLTLSLNQVAGFKDGVSIRPVAVVEDSRCPADVECIQAGTVRLSLKADVNGTDSTQTIELGKSVTVGGDTISFTSVDPARTTAGAPAQSAYRFTFRVEAGGSPVSAGPCYVGGCSSQLCTDAPGAISNCIYRAEYACYRSATCERQTNGSCGWTETPALSACLANPPAL